MIIETMTKEEFNNSIKTDPLNINNKRNQRNSPVGAYNCGGFALSVYDWVCPYIPYSDDSFDEDDNDWSEEERDMYINFRLGTESLDTVVNEVLEKDVNFLLKNYPILQIVNPDECEEDDVLIAYRIFITDNNDEGIDTDFHFRVRYHGFWFEKMGSTDITICTGSVEEPWKYNDETIYNSKIVYFKLLRRFLIGDNV